MRRRDCPTYGQSLPFYDRRQKDTCAYFSFFASPPAVPIKANRLFRNFCHFLQRIYSGISERNGEDFLIHADLLFLKYFFNIFPSGVPFFSYFYPLVGKLCFFQPLRTEKEKQYKYKNESQMELSTHYTRTGGEKPKLAQELGISPILAQLLVQREITEAADALGKFFRPQLPDLQ